MADHSPAYLRNYALLMRAPQHGWIIMPLMQALIERSVSPEGQLSGTKDCFATKDYAVALATRYFSSLRPRGGSWAGAVRGQNNEPDPTGESDMSAVITTLKTDLSEKTKEIVDNAARVLLVIVKDLILNETYGLRAVVELCELVDVDGAADAYSLLNDCMSQLDPLEALLYGPGDLIALQAEGVTHHGIRFRATDLRRYERRLLAAFRTSTSERQLSSATLLERRSVIRTLQYMQSKAFLLDHRGQRDAPTPSAQQVTRDFFHRVCCERGAAIPREAEQIEMAMQVELSGIQAGRVICDQSLRVGRAVGAMALASMRSYAPPDRPSRPTRDAIAAATPGRRSKVSARAESATRLREAERGSRPRANAVRPNIMRASNMPRPGHSSPGQPLPPRSECHNCGEIGHWSRDCPHSATGAPNAKRAAPQRAKHHAKTA